MKIKVELLEEPDIRIILDWNKNKTSDFLYSWAGRGYSFPLTYEQILPKIINPGKFEKNGYSGKKRFWHSLKAKQIVFKIIKQTTGIMIGTIELSRINRKKKKAFVSRFLIGEEENRNKGYGKEALTQVIHIAHNKLGLSSLLLRVFDFNKNAIKCYENAGFKKIKYKEKTRKIGKEFWNTFTMEYSIKDKGVIC